MHSEEELTWVRLVDELEVVQAGFVVFVVDDSEFDISKTDFGIVHSDFHYCLHLNSDKTEQVPVVNYGVQVLDSMPDCWAEESDSDLYDVNLDIVDELDYC